MTNPLQIVNTGLDHCYINGIPIVEAEIDIDEVFKKVARISALAVNADPYFNALSKNQKDLSQSHGEGDRITRDFLEEGARDILPIFSPLQRLIPEGAFDARVYEDGGQGESQYIEWSNPDSDSIYIESIYLLGVTGSGDIEINFDGILVGTVSLPEGAALLCDINSLFSESFNGRNYNPDLIRLDSTGTSDFTFDYQIKGVKFEGYTWIKSINASENILLPSIHGNIVVSNLTGDFTWENNFGVKIIGVTIKRLAGNADVIISRDGIDSPQYPLDAGNAGEDYFDVTDDIGSIGIEIVDATGGFAYDMVINTLVPKTIPSPRFEFDSSWNPDKIIYRYQNMDTRSSSEKLNYTSETLRDIRVNPNIFDEVLKYLKDALKNYVLKELYEATGYDKKAVEYKKKYEMSRSQAKYWVRSEKGLLTGYTLGGV